MLQFTVQVLDKHVADFVAYMPEKVQPDLSSQVIAPMPGVVKSVAVKEGQPVRYTHYGQTSDK